VSGSPEPPPYAELAVLVAQQATLIEALQARILVRDARIAELERRLGQNSGNSSLPPSSDRFSKGKRPVRGTGRKPGWLTLSGATVAIGEEWGDHSGPVENRGLKHRGKKAARRVPAAPALVALLEKHLKDFGVGPEGRIFITRRGPGGRFVPGVGRPPSNNTYTRVWRKTRTMALTEAQQATPLAKVPYHLRHAAVSLWLNSGVPATQVAEWAGHSVAVLLKVYAQCIDGQEDAARLRIQTTLTVPQ
jgi:integrase